MPKFAHAARTPLAGGRWLLGSYHPSQQNTFTGVLTETMFDQVFREARKLLAAS
jgi:uracil-DNA glycosylase